MLSQDWTDEDLQTVDDALAGRYLDHRWLAVWTAMADTTRSWSGTRKGLHSVDTRHQIKNNAEYHGLERHAWQYFATIQYEEARDHFYAAALLREVDLESILSANPRHEADASHLDAISFCLKMARYSDALSEPRSVSQELAVPERFELDSDLVDKREAKAHSEIASHSK